MRQSSSDRETGHRHSVAPERLPPVLALLFPTQTGWQAGDPVRGSGFSPDHASENPAGGTPRIHGELLKLGFEISERTVSRYLSHLHRRDGTAQLRQTFLKNHRELITGMDFFAVITANFRILHCLFLIRHDRREIVHWNVTAHPTGEWVVQQLREAFPESTDDQYLIFDQDAKFSADESIGDFHSQALPTLRAGRNRRGCGVRVMLTILRRSRRSTPVLIALLQASINLFLAAITSPGERDLPAPRRPPERTELIGSPGGERVTLPDGRGRTGGNRGFLQRDFDHTFKIGKAKCPAHCMAVDEEEGRAVHA